MKASDFLESSLPFVVVMVLLMSPFLVVSWVSGGTFYDNHRLIEIACFLFVLVVIFFKFFSGKPFPDIVSKEIAYVLIYFFAIGFISSAMAFSPRHAFFEFASFIVLMGISWLIASEIVVKGEVVLDKVLLLIGVACALYILLSIFVCLAFIKTGVQPQIGHLILGYDNYRSFNYVQTISLPMLGLLAARMPTRDRRLIWWAVVSLWWMLLFVGAGRGTLLGIFVGIVVALVAMRRGAVAWCISVFLSGLAGLTAYLIFYVLLPLQRGLQPFGLLFFSLDRTIHQDDPSSGRFILWTRAWELIQESPWVGVGPAHFAHYARDLPFGASPHNWVLQIASEWGLPALLCVCVALFLAFRRLPQSEVIATEKSRATLAACWATGAAILVDGLFSGLIVMPVSQLWIALYMGCAWGWVASLSPPRHTTGIGRKPKVRFITGSAALVLTAMLIGGVWPDLQELALGKQLRPEKTQLKPRILSDGNF